MHFSGKAVALPVLLTVALAGAAGAQAPACEIDEGSPSQVAKAYLSLTQAASLQQAERWGDAATQLRSAVKSVTERPDRIKNTVGRDVVLGKAMSLWLNQPDQAHVASKAALGFAEGGEGTIDLVVAVDSLFSPVEQAQPGCVAPLSDWRRQKAWIAMINQSIDHVNADRLDSAEYVANRSLLLNKSPYAYMVLGNVAQNRQATADAMKFYKQTIETATDSAYADVRNQTYVTLGNLAADAAESAEGAERMRLAQEAATAYRGLLAVAPQSLVASQARAGLSRSLLLQGDTVAFRAALKDHMENPTQYSYQDVLASAVTAARAGQWTEAGVLFEGALQNNPYNRDALFNLALTYNELKQYDKMLPFVHRLVAVDPSNGENWRLYAYAYNGLAKATKVAPQVRALNDSTVKYFEMAEKMPHRVTFTEFSNTPEKTSVAGSVENRSTGEKSFTLQFEFLDKAGAVVGTREATVGPVAPNAQGRFNVTLEGAPSAVAFRYAPLPVN